MTVTAGADMKDLPEGMPRGGGCGMREREGPAPDGGGALDQKLVGGLGGDMVSDIRSDAQ